MKRLHLAGANFLAAGLAFPGATFAGVIITVEEVGGDVVATGTGTLDLAAWTFSGTAALFGSLLPSQGLIVGPAAQFDQYGAPINFAGPANFGPGTNVFIADSGTGDLFGLDFSIPALSVPEGYVSGAQLVGTATWNGHTFASLGVAKGIYTWTWGVADPEFLTINIIPAPGALGLLGVAGLLGTRRRRRQ